MLYNEFESRLDEIQSEIRALKTKGQLKEAAIKGLDLIYLKVNYYEQCIENNKIHPVGTSYESTYTAALKELALKRDYLYDKFGYEEA